MNRIIKTTLTICTAAIALTSFSSSAVAGQRWSGNGEIIDGLGEGARVQLDLDVSNNDVIIKSSPSSGERVNLNQSTKTNTGTWKVYNCNSDANICATLEQNRPQRTIKYRLYRQ